MLARGWYLEISDKRHWRSCWPRRASVVLAGSTLLAVVLWGLRFAGLLGARPFQGTLSITSDQPEENEPWDFWPS